MQGRCNEADRTELRDAAARFVSRKRAGSVRQESSPADFPDRSDLDPPADAGRGTETSRTDHRDRTGDGEVELRSDT
jgi:hypothetical protein